MAALRSLTDEPLVEPGPHWTDEGDVERDRRDDERERMLQQLEDEQARYADAYYASDSRGES